MTDDSQDLLARARELEESGKLEPALELYRRLLDREAPAAAMAQRHLRAAEVERALDDHPTAASDYERASALFVEAGLDNLALAVDQRLLRLDPERTEAYLRLGRLSAEHGYERDARRGYVEFADRISAAGDSDRAVEALQSYLESFPSDAAVRRRLGELGGTAVAAPEPPPAEPEPSPGAEPEPEPQPLEDLGLQPTSLAEQEEEWEPAAPAEQEPVVLEGFEPTGATEWEEVSTDEDELPLIGNAAEGLEAAEEETEEDEEEPTRLDEPLPLLGAMGEEVEVEVEEEVEEEEVEEDELDALERRVARAEESGDRFELAAACLALARRAEAELDPERARELYRRVLELDPVNEEARRGVGTLAPGAAAADDFVDLGALVLGDEPELGSTPFAAEQAPQMGDGAEDFEELLGSFDEVAADEEVEESDAASHYDLGLAFKEMGLFDKAVAQLRSALRGGANPLAVLEALGESFVQKGDCTLAERVLDRATRLPGASEMELVGVYYWLGCCQEKQGEMDRARASFERVVEVDGSFRDAAERLRALNAS